MRYRTVYRPASTILGRNVELALTAKRSSVGDGVLDGGGAGAGPDPCDVVVAWNYDSETGLLTVTVTDPDGTPVPGAVVTLTPV